MSSSVHKGLHDPAQPPFLTSPQIIPAPKALDSATLALLSSWTCHTSCFLYLQNPLLPPPSPPRFLFRILYVSPQVGSLQNSPDQVRSLYCIISQITVVTLIGTITYLMSVSPTAHSSEAGTHLFCLPFCSQLLIHGLIHSRFRKKDC